MRNLVKIEFIFKKDILLMTQPSFWEKLIIIYYFHYNGKSMIHSNHMHIFTPLLDKTPAKFQKDTGKLQEDVSQDTQCMSA